MRKTRLVLFILATTLCLLGSVSAEEKYTITYDANDGTGRTQVVEIDTSEIIMPDIDFFGANDLDDDNYLNKPVINSWNLVDNANLFNYSDTRYYSNYTYTIDDLFDGTRNIILYAEWQKKEQIAPENIYINGTYSGGKRYGGRIISCDIEPKTDFEIKFSNFARRTNQQFLYYELPECFINSLPNYLNNGLSTPLSLKEKINYLGSIMTYEGGTFYIKDGILFVNLVNDGTTEYRRMNGISSVSFAIRYSFTFTNTTYNNRIIKVLTVSGEANDQSGGDPFVVYPTGNIQVKYIDKNSGMDIRRIDNYEGIIGDKYSIIVPEIDGYKFYNENEIGEYLFEEETRTVVLKYVNLSNKYSINVEVKNETEDLNIALTDITQVEYEEQVKFNVTPIKGYKVNSIKIIDEDNNEIEYNKTKGKDEYTFTMPASDVTIIPSYERVSNSVNVEEDTGTKEIVIEVNDIRTVVYEDKVVFTVVPEDGYEVETIEIIDKEGNKIEYKKTDNENEYEFIMPDTDVTIKPIYRKIESIIDTEPEKKIEIEDNPNTGDMVLIMALVMMLSIGIIAILRRKQINRYYQSP